MFDTREFGLHSTNQVDRTLGGDGIGRRYRYGESWALTLS